MIFNTNSKEYQLYFHYIKSVSSLSKLFSESDIPFLHYRLAENLFCKAFNAENLSRTDTAYDAKIDNIGIGIKTFVCPSNSKTEKIAEFDRKNSDIIKDVDSEYSRIFVKQVVAKDTTYKTLQVDDGLESYIDEETGKMGAEYLYYYNLANYYLKNNKSTLMIGGAAYTYPTYYLNNFKDKTIDVSEIDEKMTKLAASEFSLDTNNPRLHIYHQDGRSFLNKTTNKYDVILIDAFKGTNAPFELTTYEAMENAKKSLNDNGMVITNIISSVTGSESKFINYEYSTYKKVFDDVKVFKVNNINDNTRQNLILIGFKGNKEVDETVYEQYKNLLDNELKDFSSNTGISTDNYAPIGN